MPSTLTRYALQYHFPSHNAEAVQALRKVKTIASCIILCVLCFASGKSVLANDGLILNTIPPLTIHYGKPFVYQFESPIIEPEYLRIRLINKPRHAVLSTDYETWPIFSWTPAINVLPKTVVIVQAYDVRDKSKISTQRMVLEKGLYTANDNDTAISAPVITKNTTTTQAPEVKAPDVKAPVVTAPLVKAPIEKILTNDKLARSKTPQPIDDASSAASTSGIAQAFVEETIAKQAQPSKSKGGHAPQLAALEPQTVTVGVELQLFIRPIDLDGDQVSLSVKNLPLGAELRNISAGSWLLNWRPEASQAGEHQITLIATENTASAFKTQRVLTLDVRDPNARTLVLASAKVTTDGISTNEVNGMENVSGDSLAGDTGSINFEPLSAQIVSAGQTINLPIVSRVGQNSKTILHIDRLPSGATFDLNDDGTRTFHWPTSNSDQGEHVFRFTAVNPKDASQTLSKELLIVVGDPAAPGSMPR